MWRFEGAPARLLSRATDETGYVQPTRTALLAVRGPGTDYHYNQIVGCDVAADGAVTFFGES
jgi:sulfane dehydrogenase subunit SoxC